MSGRIALVTGANRGLGFGVSEELAKLGYKVLMVGRTIQKVEIAAEKLKKQGFDVEALPADVSVDEEVKRMAIIVAEKHGHLDVLVNNAGVYLENMDGSKPHLSSTFKVDPTIVVKTFNINSAGPLRMIQAFAPLLDKSEAARIVNVSSGMGQLSDMQGQCPGYRMSKTALNALTRILAAEWNNKNVKINSVCPGWVKTDMGGPNATRGLDEGVRGIIWAATLPEDGPTGGFFRDGQLLDW